MSGLTTSRAERREATAQKILDAARQEFGGKGFTGATMRSIAGRAGVDQALVHQHYGSKDDLFTAAIGLGGEIHGDAASHLADVLATKLGELPPETLVLLRSMLTSPEANREISSFMDGRVEALTRSINAPDARARALLAISSNFGLTILRHFLDLPSIKDVDPERLMGVAGPWFESLTNPGL